MEGPPGQERTSGSQQQQKNKHLPLYVGLAAAIVLIAATVAVALMLSPKPNAKTGIDPCSVITPAQIQSPTGWKQVRPTIDTPADHDHAGRTCKFVAAGGQTLIVKTWVAGGTAAVSKFQQLVSAASKVRDSTFEDTSLGAEGEASFDSPASSTTILVEDGVVVQVTGNTLTPEVAAFAVGKIDSIYG